MINSILTESLKIFSTFLFGILVFSIAVTWIICTSVPIFYDYLKIKWKMIQSSLNQ